MNFGEARFEDGYSGLSYVPGEASFPLLKLCLRYLDANL
jgi:hypothetical protein